MHFYDTLASVRLCVFLLLAFAAPHALVHASFLQHVVLDMPEMQTDGVVQAIAVQPDGKIVIGGTFSHVNGIIRSNIARFNRQGTLDLSWNPNCSGPVYSLAIDQTNLFVGGHFIMVHATERQVVAKIPLSGDGRIDFSWNAGLDAVQKIYALFVKDANIYAAGEFVFDWKSIPNNVRKFSTRLTGPENRLFKSTLIDSIVYSMAADDSFLYLAGYFNVDSKAYRAVRLSLASGALDKTWTPIFTQGQPATAQMLDGRELYLAGSTLQRFNIDTGDGSPDPLLPSGDVRVILRVEDKIYVAGSAANSDSPGYLVQIPLSLNPPDWQLGADGSVFAAAARGKDMILGGYFKHFDRHVAGGIALLATFEGQPIVATNFTVINAPTPVPVRILPFENDELESRFFRVTGIANGKVFEADGSPVLEGSFVTAASATNGLSFVPASGFTGMAQFVAQAASSAEVAAVGGAPAVVPIVVLPEKRLQEISWTLPSEARFGDGPIPLSASSSSGKAVSFEVASGSASISNSVLFLTGAGTIKVRAVQPGDDLTASATFEKSILVAKSPQTITFNPASAAFLTESPIFLQALSSSGLPVRFTAQGAGVSISGDSVLPSQPGEVTIIASQEGNIDFEPADKVSRTLLIKSPPANDNFANALPLPLNAEITTSSLGASLELNEPSPNGSARGHSLWWILDPRFAGLLSISTTGSTFPTVVRLYTGLDLTTLSSVSFLPTPSGDVAVQVQPGTRYHLAVDGENDQAGELRLWVTLHPEAPPVFISSTTIDNAVILWPVGFGDFLLETSDSTRGPWQPSLLKPVTGNNINTTSIKTSDHGRFYRLRSLFQ